MSKSILVRQGAVALSGSPFSIPEICAVCGVKRKEMPPETSRTRSLPLGSIASRLFCGCVLFFKARKRDPAHGARRNSGSSLACSNCLREHLFSLFLPKIDTDLFATPDAIEKSPQKHVVFLDKRLGDVYNSLV